ncbi:MAG: hypothetical protein U0U46_17365 [Saprospiraceae bacterium]
MRSYSAKLLLFGEHVLLLGAPALAVPVPALSGFWDWRSPDTPLSETDMQLLEFSYSPLAREVREIDWEAFENDLGLGLFFNSNIPTGYGLGSSGALVAAVYDRYALSKNDDPVELKRIFSAMERYFHGESSGIDPLTSYLDLPLTVRDIGTVTVAQTALWKPRPPVVFLLDSQLPRRTGPMVQWFREQSAEPAFFNAMKAEYLPALEAAIAAWQLGDLRGFEQALALVSRFQLDNMQPLIPPSLLDLWRHATERSQGIYFKLCGAGGGGYLLGFAPTREAAKATAGKHPVIFPFEKGHTST